MRPMALTLHKPSDASAPHSKNELLARTRQAIARARNHQVAYADEDFSPLSEITLALILKRAGIQWQYQPLRGLVEIVWPPICGVHLIMAHDYLTPGERRFAVRHGLAHVLMGDVGEGGFARSRHDWRQPEEVIADLFAWADLIPDRMLEERRAAGYSRAELEGWTIGEMQRYTPGWAPERILDRMALRHYLWEEAVP